ncbi:MAG: TonB-dependent receptor plug domain-containing protein [Bacteroidales bacterium]|nr:TonB-dependent receptor plug domain-containing protein [Bacteroidales bacterium]
MKKIIYTIIAVMSIAPVSVFAQDIDTDDIYGDRADSLNATVFVGRQQTSFLSKQKPVRTEVITAAGLCTMACCNLAESFENSASVTVGYSDAVTGARQIRLLGLSGTYTQMLDENRPVMRGLAAPFGLAYVPGQWLESIQIAKGATSVINGVESITGQINMEHRKPTDEKPLFINLSTMNDTKTDFNIASSLQLNDSWSTVLLGHVSGNFISMDENMDGFLDDPKQLQFNLSNRWLYYSLNGVQVRFGVRAIRDTRRGGQYEMHTNKKGDMSMWGQPEYVYDNYMADKTNAWGSNILNQSIGGYLKVGVPLNEDGCRNIAAVLDYTYYDMNSHFGATSYIANQHSAFVNLLYQDEINEDNHFTLGLSATGDVYKENLERILLLGKYAEEKAPALVNAGIFGEYTFHAGEKFSSILGLRGDWFKGDGFKFSPRLTLKYAPVEDVLVLRANAGRGIRYSSPLTDNIGVFSTSKEFKGDFNKHLLEDAWIFGGNATYYFPLGASDNAYVSFDYFRTQFVQQAMVDYEHYMGAIDFYDLKSLDHGRSFTDTYQLDFSCEPFRGFTVTLTGRYTNAKTSLADRVGLVEKPMTSKYKGVLTLQYATNLNKWIFDFTASVNGPSRVYDFMANLKDSEGNLLYKDGKTPVYPLLYAQVTKRFKGVDIYVGGENLTNFRQKNVILGHKNGEVFDTFAPDFDASCVWGPLMGIKVYAGLRFTLWKTE